MYFLAVPWLAMVDSGTDGHDEGSLAGFSITVPNRENDVGVRGSRGMRMTSPCFELAMIEFVRIRKKIQRRWTAGGTMPESSIQARGLGIISALSVYRLRPDFFDSMYIQYYVYVYMCHCSHVSSAFAGPSFGQRSQAFLY